MVTAADIKSSAVDKERNVTQNRHRGIIRYLFIILISVIKSILSTFAAFPLGGILISTKINFNCNINKDNRSYALVLALLVCQSAKVCTQNQLCCGLA